MMQENPNKEKIVELRNQGLSYGSIAKLFNLSRSRIHQICSGYQNPSEAIYKSILLRDNFTCQWKEKCKNKKTNLKDLVIHHIDFNDKNNSTDNLLTTCKFCHASFHSKTFHKDPNKKIDVKQITPKKIVRRVCFICKKEFIPKGYNYRKSCSDECLKRFQDKMHEAMEKSNPELYKGLREKVLQDI